MLARQPEAGPDDLPPRQSVRSTRPGALAGQADVLDQVVDGHLEDPRQGGEIVKRRLPAPLLPPQDQAVVAMKPVGQPAQGQPTNAAQVSEAGTETVVDGGNDGSLRHRLTKR